MPCASKMLPTPDLDGEMYKNFVVKVSVEEEGEEQASEVWLGGRAREISN